MGYHYPLINDCVDTPHMRLASIADIGCMKLSAIVSRAELKDYVDLFFILKHIPLDNLLADLSHKLPSLDRNFVLKALVSFDDLSQDPIDFTAGYVVSTSDIESALRKAVQALPLGVR